MSDSLSDNTEISINEITPYSSKEFSEELIFDKPEEEDEQEEEEEEEEDDEDEDTSEDGDYIYEAASCEKELASERNSFGWTRICFGDFINKEDEYKTVRPINYDDIELSEDEKFGWLSPRIMATGLSNLRQLPNSSEYALTKLELPQKNLKDIWTLEDYPRLISVDLSYNKVADLEPLENLKYVMYLNLSWNRISSLKNFPTPLFLTDLDLSHNNIFELIDFSPCWSLRRLNLASNNIDTIFGLDKLRYLVSLDLSDNSLEEVSNLSNTNIKELNLSDNCILTWVADGIITNTSLTKLNISRNQLSSLRMFKDAHSIRILDISFNNFSNILELDFLKHLRIIELNVEGNEISEFDEARRFLIYTIPSLIVLNNKPVNAIERVFAAHVYCTCLVKRAFYSYLYMLAKRHTLGPNNQGVDLTMQNFNPAIVALVGPPGSMKQEVIKSICSTYPQYVRMGIFHTTLTKVSSSHSENGSSFFKHVTADEFNTLLTLGKFAIHEFKRGHNFGLTWDELAYDGKVCLLGLELSMALSLQWLGFQATLILTLTGDEDLHRSRLHKMYRKSDQVAKSSESTVRDVINEGLSMLFKNPEVDVNKLLQFTNETIYHDDGLENDNCEYSDYQFILSESKSNESRQIGDNDDFITVESVDPRLWFGVEEMKTKKGSHESDREGSVCFCKSSPDNSVHVTYKEEESGRPSATHYHFLLDSAFRAKKEYSTIHEDMPGLFLFAVRTDNLEKAAFKIIKVVKDIYNNLRDNENSQEKHKWCYNIEEDPLYDKIVGSNVNEMISEIASHQSSSGIKHLKRKQLLASVLDANWDPFVELD